MAAKKNDQFEERMKRLEEIVALLESPEITLEKSMELYREGKECSRVCREKLENAKRELEIWSGEREEGDEE
ncbi:MAG: exodeoxyribonuclease VII small subunit [Desulfovibrio sp.]|nr:exodeoxyribonuclease VII small subunit [Desulfovibrio sp.]